MTFLIVFSVHQCMPFLDEESIHDTRTLLYVTKMMIEEFILHSPFSQVLKLNAILSHIIASILSISNKIGGTTEIPILLLTMIKPDTFHSISYSHILVLTSGQSNTFLRLRLCD
jgi:hypothetical protein